MAESDVDSYYGVKAVEARQLAWLTGQFYDALTVQQLPEPLVHDLVIAWFDMELNDSEMVIDDD